MVESSEALHSFDSGEDRTFRVVIYSVNQKGRSPKVILKDLLIGDRDHHSACKWFICHISTNDNNNNYSYRKNLWRLSKSNFPLLLF